MKKESESKMFVIKRLSSYKRGFNLKKKLSSKIELVVFILIILIFLIKISNYLSLTSLNPLRLGAVVQTGYQDSKQYFDELKYFHSCPGKTIKIDIGQQYLCRQATKPSVYQKIYDTYSRDPKGIDVVYPYLNEWSKATADDLLGNRFDVERYQPYKENGPITWTEDPYNDEYWRFNFYSLRVFKDLLGASNATHNSAYTAKLISVMNSFVSTGVNQPHAWDDYHAVAWRSMMLTDIWWKLRAQNELPISTSNAMLASIEQHGNFLLDPNHFESQYNHGTNEAAALYELGVSFPDLPNAAQWRAVGKQRLADGLASIIDNNGALVEHSPYYDFYALEKYWDIYKYANDRRDTISTSFNQKITAMINYATYILQPNLHVPLIGSSLDTQIHLKNEYAEMAKQDPEFKYVLTKGKSGKKPKNTSVEFTSTGQTIMRSGWSVKNFTQQTQVILNYGDYITIHSHLDALSLELYGGGTTLLPGPGLYTYNAGPLHDYFSGTSAHNTVVVDSKDQSQGSGVAGKFINTKDYVSQSATEELNSGVVHERQVTMIGQKLILVIDKLHSNTTHQYDQIFHLFPGAKFTSPDNMTVTGQGAESQQRVTIHQLATSGVSMKDVYNDQDPSQLGGLCSQQYGQLLPCHQVEYMQNAKDATFVTVLTVGKPDPSISYSYDASTGTIHTTNAGKKLSFHISETEGTATTVKATDTKKAAPSETTIDDLLTPSNWTADAGSVTASSDAYPGGKGSLLLTTTTPQSATMTKAVSLDLTNKDLLFRLKIPNALNTGNVSVIVSSNNTSYASLQLKNAYDNIHDTDQNTPTDANVSVQNDGWSTISLGKGAARTVEGQWTITGGSFDWSNISSIGFRVESVDGSPASIYVGQLSTIPGQVSGKISLVFDDGTTSVLSAVDAMKKYNYKGSVAVIGKYSERDNRGYLNVEQLENLKAQDWSLVNHSYYHQDAVTTYYDTGKLDDFKNDVLKGAEFLEKNDLDTDPNWFVYPHGTTNTTLENIISPYYKFARTELTAPEVYPFGDPLAVKDFVVQNTTPASDVIKAIDDANKYHQTLILTFHRIHATPTDRPGYSIDDFDTILAHLNSTHSQVLSLNQLDTSNGVSINKLTISDGVPPQIETKVTSSRSLLSSIAHKLL